MVNIREHVSWAHMNEPEKATEKAKHLIRAAVERAALLEEIGTASAPVKPSVLVIGGGVAGLEAAVGLANYGFEVHLVERNPTLGGKALQLGRVFPTEDCGVCVAPNVPQLHRQCLYKASALRHPNINVYTLSNLKSLEGYIGNFRAVISVNPRYVDSQRCISCGLCVEVCPVEVSNGYDLGLSKRKAVYLPATQSIPPTYILDMDNCTRCGKCVEVCPTKAINLEDKPSEVTVDIGAVVVAVGFDEWKPPKGFLGYGEHEDIITQLKLARMLDPSGPTRGLIVKPSNGEKPRKIVMIQCAGSRDKETHAYCSKICCTIALKHARSIKLQQPEAEITICYRDIRLPGKNYEHYYMDCQELDVKFVNYESVKVSITPEKKIKVNVEDKAGGEVELEADLLVLSVALVPPEGFEELVRKLNLSCSQDGFLMELHPKLAPVDTNVDGIYICGACQSPKDISESIEQAKAAVSRAASMLARGMVEVDLARAVVDEDLCIGCGNCITICPYRAIEFTPRGTARIIEIACKGCGLCVVECPARAIQLRHFKDNQLLAQVTGVLGEG
jgi:heterodisulfide reductase subunit A